MFTLNHRLTSTNSLLGLWTPESLPDAAQHKTADNLPPLHGVEDLAGHLGKRKLRVATMCFGTVSPLLAFGPISPHNQEELRQGSLRWNTYSGVGLSDSIAELHPTTATATAPSSTSAKTVPPSKLQNSTYVKTLPPSN